MARRKKLLTEVPAEVLKWFNAELVAGNFSDYRGMTGRLNDRLKAAGLEVVLAVSTVHNYGKDYEEEFKAEMAESTRFLRVAETAMAQNEDPDRVILGATVRSLQTRLLRLSMALRDCEEAGDDPHMIADTTAKLARAVANLGRIDIQNQKFINEERARISAELETMKRSGDYDGATLDAVQQRVAVYLPDNRR